jgi:hypothetical protein
VTLTVVIERKLNRWMDRQSHRTADIEERRVNDADWMCCNAKNVVKTMLLCGTSCFNVHCAFWV